MTADGRQRRTKNASDEDSQADETNNYSCRVGSSQRHQAMTGSRLLREHIDGEGNHRVGAWHHEREQSAKYGQ